MALANVLVVGAGLAGLTSALALQKKGFQVTVIDRTSGIQDIGGPISIRPVAVRMLYSLGLGEVLFKNSEQAIATWKFHRYDSGETLGEMDITASSSDNSRDSLCFARPILHKVLYQEALKRNIVVKFGEKVVEAIDDDKNPAVRLKDGQVIKADFIVAADGTSSPIRDSILPPDPNRILSILSAFTFRAPISAVQKDPSLADYLSKAHYWLGPGRMAIGCPLEKTQVFDLHFYIDKELGTLGEWDQKIDPSEIIDHFTDFDPVLAKFRDLVSEDDSYVWRISGLAPLPSWSSKSGRIAFVGDAAHAMVPYVAQGASQGIEDAVVLAECLDRLKANPEIDVKKLVGIYEEVRRPRAEAAQRYSTGQQLLNHAPDGPIQQKRDEMMKIRFNETKPIGWDGKIIREPPPVGSLLIDAYLLHYDAMEHLNEVLEERLSGKSNL